MKLGEDAITQIWFFKMKVLNYRTSTTSWTAYSKHDVWPNLKRFKKKFDTFYMTISKVNSTIEYIPTQIAIYLDVSRTILTTGCMFNILMSKIVWRKGRSKANKLLLAVLQGYTLAPCFESLWCHTHLLQLHWLSLAS